MNRLFSSLFVQRPNTQNSRASASRNRSVRFQVEPLEGRQLMAVLPPGPNPPAVTATVMNDITAYVNAGLKVSAANERLAETYFNDAYDLAQQTRYPFGFVEAAFGWSTLPAGTSGYPGTVASNYYAQAIGQANFWIDPLEGTGSGADYAWGANQLQIVINSSGPLIRNLEGSEQTQGSWKAIDSAAVSYQNYLSNMEAQAIPPIAAGTWSVNILGTTMQFTLNQNVGYAAGRFVNGSGDTGNIEQAQIMLSEITGSGAVSR